MGTSSPSISFRGIAAPFFALAGPSDVDVPEPHEGRIATAAFYDVLARLRHIQHDRSPGIVVSAVIGPPVEPEVRAMVTCAPTIADAFLCLRDSCAIFMDDVALELVPEGRYVAMRPVIRPEGHEGTNEIAAALLAGGLGYLTRALGHVPPHHAVLGHTRGARAHVRTVFGRVSETRREHVLLVPRAVLGVRPKTANDALFAYFARETRTRAERRAWGTSATERVRALLLAHRRPLRASVITVAEALGTCTRTLQRRLEAEGTTFARVQGTVLRHRAIEGLATGTARDVGHALGYADASAFHRAVRGWCGLTPGQLGTTLRA